MARAQHTTSKALADAHPRKGEASIGAAFFGALLDVPGFFLERLSEPLRGFEMRFSGIRSSAYFSILLVMGCGGPGAMSDSNTGAAPSAGAGPGMSGASSGGAAGSSGGVDSVGGEGQFELLFRDDFDEFDSTRWQVMTHSWDGNLALFSSESVAVADGELSVTLLEAPDGTTDDQGAEKPFLGAEVRSRDAVTYGRVKARAKLAKGNAVVSSLVTIYTPWPADNWNELDIEFLGKDPTEVQFNAMVYTGPLPAPTTPVSPTQDPTMYDLGFDSSADFHEYTIEWTPEAARYFVDGQLAHTWDASIDLMTLPQNILLTIWASSSESWAGPVDETTTGARAVYDWVEVYEYTP